MSLCENSMLMKVVIHLNNTSIENIKEQEIQIDTIPTDQNLNLMQKIANNNHTFDDIKMLTSSQITDQLKVFLIAQARNHLNKVIKLTMFLDRVEDSFIENVDIGMETNDLSFKDYYAIIDTISKLLESSNAIISKVLNDENLTTILNTTIYQVDNSQHKTVISNLKDAQSRERVRNVLKQIIESTDNYITNPQEFNEKELESNE